MKKRSMLAIASLATGFVVAAVTPSHSLGSDLTDLDVGKALSGLSTVEDTVASDSLAVEDNALGQND
ncbi:hypothetical protein [Streptomyces sp. P17]|uniref:hypothetical protein n=1 Tax=Streptomyces sp. P17 TaxID=3074716 RepID=UPI0028F3E807|nr:hypothetical protein [Streptomyces sp. P17]MDT9701298.1 hypothetical protein [Streptomyces sp. P17]